MNMSNYFTKHLDEVGEGYFEHMMVAGTISLKLSKIAVIMFAHAIFPFLFETLGSDSLKLLMKDMNNRIARIEDRTQKSYGNVK